MRQPPSVQVLIDACRARCGADRFGPYLIWAVQAVESLRYLDDLDEHHASVLADPRRAHHRDVVDSAHVRWATSTALTTLDLCAAGASRQWTSYSKDHEMDLRQLVDSKRILGELPKSIGEWVFCVVTDHGYQTLLSARKTLTHGMMRRQLVEGESGHGARNTFDVNAQFLGARQLVELSTAVARSGRCDFADAVAVELGVASA